jgi:hypothetical protein
MNTPSTTTKVSLSKRLIWSGVGMGIFFPLAAVLIDIFNRGLPLNFTSAIKIHQTDRLIEVILKFKK